jgi:hypothetical protein
LAACDDAQNVERAAGVAAHERVDEPTSATGSNIGDATDSGTNNVAAEKVGAECSGR